MSNISTCEAVELVRNAIDPYSMMGISADDMVYASVKRHMLSLFEKPEGECLHRISFAEFADKVTKTTRIQGEWVDEIPVFEPGDDYGQYTWNICYRRCAKKLIDEDLIYGVTNANYAKRPDAMKITAVIYQLMYGDKEADYAKLLSLFGKEYASTADVVSGLYRRMADPTAKLPFKYIKDTWGSDLGNVAVFAIYLLASPESYLPQNRKSFERLSEVFSQINSTRKNTSPMSDQQKVLMKYGISIQKNFSDFETAAMQGSRTRTIPVENEDGTCTQDTIFSYSDYGVHCHSELLSGLAMLDAGVSNCSNYDKTITKQKFLDAQKAVAKSLNFTKEMDGKVKFGDMFSLIDDGHIKVDEKGNIKADEDSGLATIELINLYNMMVPVYLSFRNLSEAYKEEIQSSLSDSLFGNTKNSDSEKLMKKIEELEKMLDKAKADAARAIEAENAAEQKLIQSKKRENALTSKLETAYKEIDELMERIPEPEEAEVVCEAEEERQEPVQQVQAKDYAAALDALLKQHTVVIVGGNENLMKKFQVAHPDASLVAKDMLGTCDQQIQNADIVMFKVDSCSHALYNKGKTICNRYDVPFCYIPNVASIPRIEQSMCEQLEEIFS